MVRGCQKNFALNKIYDYNYLQDIQKICIEIPGTTQVFIRKPYHKPIEGR